MAIDNERLEKSLDFLTRTEGFEPENYPEGYKKTPHCPLTKTINICAELAGIEFNPEKFCGNDMYNVNRSGGFFPHLISADYSPRTTCRKVHEQLINQMSIVSKDMTKTKENKTRKEQLRITTIDRWREVVFNYCCLKDEDQPNHHIGACKSSKDLSEKEIIENVGHFIASLKEITGYEPGIATMKALHCPQSPIHHHYGPQ